MGMRSPNARSVQGGPRVRCRAIGADGHGTRPGFFVYRSAATPRRGTGRRTWPVPSRVGISRLVTTQSNLPTMMVRCVVGAMARLSPRHRCCVLPASLRRGRPQPDWCRPCRFVRSLSVHRPEFAPPHRGCILLAVAVPSRLRTHATAPCYTPLNDGWFQRCNRGYVVVVEPSSDTPVGLPSGQRTHHA